MLDEIFGSRSFGEDKGGKKIAAFDWVPKEHRALAELICTAESPVDFSHMT